MAPTTYRLMTVNKVPERAKRLVGRVTEILNNSQEYNIEHVANCESKTGLFISSSASNLPMALANLLLLPSL